MFLFAATGAAALIKQPHPVTTLLSLKKLY